MNNTDGTKRHETAVRAATFTDIPHLVAAGLALAEETEGLRLDPARLERGVRAVLDDPQKGFYLVAEADGETAGSLLVTPEWSDWRDAWYWWIQSVYVRPEFRRCGVYRALHRHVLEQARRRTDVWGVRLYVDHDNRPAQAAYQRLGMRPSRYRFYEMDFGQL